MHGVVLATVKQYDGATGWQRGGGERG